MKLSILKKFGPDSIFEIKNENQIDYCQENELIVKQKSVLITSEDFNVKNGIFAVNQENQSKILGLSGVGVVEKKGTNVKSFNEGDLIVYASSPFGGYSEKRVIDYNFCISVPDNLNSNLVCASFRKILAARYFLLKIVTLHENEFIVITKAEAEYGIFLVKIAKIFKLKVIAVTSNKDLIGKIFSFGADFVITDDDKDLEKKILEYTQGNGVRAIFDQQGESVFSKLSKVISTFGYYIYYGYPVGDMKQIDIAEFKSRHLHFICTSFEMLHLNRYDFILNSIEVFKIMQEFESLQILKYRFEDINQAYNDFQNNKGLSSTILIF